MKEQHSSRHRKIGAFLHQQLHQRKENLLQSPVRRCTWSAKRIWILLNRKPWRPSKSPTIVICQCSFSWKKMDRHWSTNARSQLFCSVKIQDQNTSTWFFNSSRRRRRSKIWRSDWEIKGTIWWYFAVDSQYSGEFLGTERTQRGGRKKRFQYCLNPDASNTSLYFRAIQGDSGANYRGSIIARQCTVAGWLRRAHPPRRERLRDAFHYLKWIDPREDEATRSTGGPVAKAKQRPKSTLKLSPVSVPNRGRKWIDINPETFSKGCFAVLKFMIGLLRHEETLLREDDMIENFKVEFAGTLQWTVSAWVSSLAEGGKKKVSILLESSFVR